MQVVCVGTGCKPETGLLNSLLPFFLVQVHSATKHVEYRGEIMSLSESLLQLPAGGQVVLSDTTFQRIGGRLHEVKLPALEFQKLSQSPDGLLKEKGDRPRDSLEGKPGSKVEGQVRLEGQDVGQGPTTADSRRSSMETTAKQAVIQAPAIIYTALCLACSQATAPVGQCHKLALWEMLCCQSSRMQLCVLHQM